MYKVLYADFMNLFMHITVHAMHNMYTQRADSSHMYLAWPASHMTDCIKDAQTQCPQHTLCRPCTPPQYGPPAPQGRRTPLRGASQSPALHHSPAPTGAAGQWSRHSRHTRSHQPGTQKGWSTLETQCGRSTGCEALWGDCCDVEQDCSSTACCCGCQLEDERQWVVAGWNAWVNREKEEGMTL